MSIFEYMPEELLGTVESVDTSTVIVKVENDDKLRGLQVNHLISIQSSKIGQHLIGLVSKIIRKSAYSDPVADVSPELGFNIIKVILIGTHFDRDAGKDNVFRRSLATIPTINAECHLIHGDRLKRFMQAISSIPEGEDAVSLQIGNYSIVEHRQPIAIFCDEAHLYIPSNTEKSIDDASLVTFERISKEGRKYGIGLVVISQRPSEVNRTVLSQSNNFIAMRLTNVDDQSVVKRLLPDSLGDYAEMLPILDIGEALVVGDASLLPSRIRITPPTLKPRSATIDFWDEWSKDATSVDISGAIEALRKQAK